MSDSRVVSVEQVLSRIHAEFLEMPGLRLTRQQAQRLWGLDEETCGTLLNRLLESGFLQVGRDGGYSRMTEGPIAGDRRRASVTGVRPPLGPIDGRRPVS